MNNGLVTSVELATSVTASSIVCLNVDASPLLTALITFGISIVTIVGGEVIKWLVAYFQKKTQDLKNGEDEKKEGK